MSEPAAPDRSIGVGMGGSCPECRAPVDLGQEFCLECGAPIRIRRQSRAGARTAAGGAAAARSARVAPAFVEPPRRGFPWIPFLAILGLVTLGVVFILAEHGSKPAKSAKHSAGNVDDDLTTTAASSNTSAFPSVQTDTTPTTTTNDDCPPGTSQIAPSTGGSGIATTADGFLTTATTPAAGTPGGPSSGQTPTAPASGSAASCTQPANSTPTPTTTPMTPTTSTFPTTPTSTTPTTTTPTSTSPTTGTSTTGTTAVGGAWPAGKHGWTVVLASFAKDRYSRSDAEARSVEAQQKGVDSGVLDSDGFRDLRTSLWVVFSGVYDRQSAADAHVNEVATKGYQGAYVREITPQ